MNNHQYIYFSNNLSPNNSILSKKLSDAAVNSTMTSVVVDLNEKKPRGEAWTDARGRFTTILPKNKPRPYFSSLSSLPFGPKSGDDSDSSGDLECEKCEQSFVGERSLYKKGETAQELQEIAKINTISNPFRCKPVILSLRLLIVFLCKHFHFKRRDGAKEEFWKLPENNKLSIVKNHLK